MSERDVDHEAGEFLRLISPEVSVPRSKTRDGWRCSRCGNFEHTNSSGRADYADFTVSNERRSRICIEVKATSKGLRYFNAENPSMGWKQKQREWARDWQKETGGVYWIWLQLGEDAYDIKIDNYWKLVSGEIFDYRELINEQKPLMPRRVFLLPGHIFERMMVIGVRNYDLPAQALFYGIYPRMKNRENIINAGLTPDGQLKEWELFRLGTTWWPPSGHDFWRIYYDYQYWEPVEQQP